MPLVRALIRHTLKAIIGTLFRVRVQGTMPAPQDRLLVIANHESFLDGLVLGLFLPLNPVFVVHTGIAANPWFRLMLCWVDYLAVDPTNPMAMKTIMRLVESGRPVVIFPEGRITTTGSLMKTYDGPALVAARTGATILPVRLDGAARTYFSRVSNQHPKSFFPRIVLSILPIQKLAMPVAPSARDRRRKAGEGMRRMMQEMIFSSRPRQSLFDALLSASSIYGRQRPLVEDMKQIEYSYGDLLKMSLALGRAVAQRTPQAPHVGVLMPNLAATLGLVFGMPAFGRVPAMLNHTAGVEGMQASCTAAQIRYIVSSRAFIAQAKLGDKIAVLKNVEIIYLEDIRAQMNIFDWLWLQCWALRCPRLASAHIDADSPAAILFTSGSEGTPKGVVLSHSALLANVAQIRAGADFSVDDKLLNALPMFHSFGLTAGSLLPVICGTKLFLYPSPLHYRVIPELAYDRNCTILLGTSTFLGNYAKFAHAYDFYRMRYVIAGAEKLNENVRQTWFEKFGIRIFEGYGATETAPVLAVNTPMAYRSGTVGQFLAGIETRLEAVPGIEDGGLLHVRGPNLMSGYLRFEKPGQLEVPSSSAGDGWYSTGDIVKIDGDGFVRIAGRVKRFAKIAGEMVSLEAVEKLAVAASAGAQHAASSKPDATRGEAIVLFTTDVMLSREALQAAAKASGAPEIAVPRQIVVLGALPLLGTGKTDYVALKKLADTQ